MAIAVTAVMAAKAAYDWSEPLDATGANIVVGGLGMQPGSGTAPVISMTYAGDAMTGVGAVVTSGAGEGHNRAVLLLHKTSPATGSNDVVASADRGTSSNGRGFTGIALSGVDISGTPHRTRVANANLTNTTIAPTPASQEGDLCVMHFCADAASVTITDSHGGTIQSQQTEDANKRTACITWPAAASPATTTTTQVTVSASSVILYDVAAYIAAASGTSPLALILQQILAFLRRH